MLRAPASGAAHEDGSWKDADADDKQADTRGRSEGWGAEDNQAEGRDPAGNEDVVSDFVGYQFAQHVAPPPTRFTVLTPVANRCSEAHSDLIGSRDLERLSTTEQTGGDDSAMLAA
jgi:hypothetical protein